ncbi:MAG TPA: hypothetical protein P5307_21095 [Pirellulaceae bacterium]|nr:hypothetical protein [Planctomycetales bacterium]MCB9940039.1 hypothetical protein [Planctomycetaceae bacterium]HRX81585.1 hypothetical protein [Pirellulaceae bacterium]
MTDVRLVAAFESQRIPIRRLDLIWEWSKDQPIYPVWLVADLGENNVGVAFADGGYAAYGHPWGLIFLDDQYSGPDFSWYATLEECLRDSGYFEIGFD